MDSSWFDAAGTLRFDELAAARTSFQKILADGVVTSTEFQEQAQRVATLFKTLETKLTPEAKEIATDALCELAVLHALSARTLRATTTDAKGAAS